MQDSMTISGLLLSIALSLAVVPMSAFAGDCTKTLMGGGCGNDLESGVSPHMRAQAPSKEAAKAKPNTTQEVAAQKAIKVSNKPAQKPNI